MAKREKKETFRTSIGGQALIEGILMRGPEKQAIVVRAPEGLVTKVEELRLVRDKYPILGLPIIRASVDHGTGFGHAGDGSANESSLVNAMDYAIRMANAGRSPAER